LLEHVGTDAVADVMERAGCSERTVLSRGIGDAAARAAGLEHTVTAHDLARLMRGIAERTLADEESWVAVEQLLARQQHRDKIPAGLPPGTYVANKTGWVDGVAHDVALVRPTGAAPFVLVVCTTVDGPAERASALIATVAQTIWEWDQG
jgi:beta-lactamase class A